MERQSDIALIGWKVIRGAKDVKSFVKFTISKSSKDKKTNKWNSIYVDVMCGDKLALTAGRMAIEGTYIYVRGNLSIGEYNGKPQYTVFANDIEPVTKDSFDKSIDAMPSTKPQETMKLEDEMPW